MKKIILSLFVVFGALTLIACNTTTGVLGDLNKPENVYAVSAVTGVDTLIGSNGAVNLDSSSEDVVMDEVLIDQAHVDTMLGILNDDGFKVVATDSDKEEYTNLITITINKGRTFEFYFNEVLVKEDSESETEDGETETELEQEFKIDGIIIEDGVEYTVTGIKEIEVEESKNEKEEEFELELKFSLNENNYTVINYETELELEGLNREFEKSYDYAIYENGKKVSQMKMEFEEEDGEIELKLEVKDLVGNKTAIYKLEIEDKTDRAIVEYVIKESGKDDVKGTIEFEIVVTDGIITYKEIIKEVEQEEATA